jgi:nicotinate-nucleotide adenylyltransferase
VSGALVLPTGRHPLKQSIGLAPDDARLELCRLAFGDLPGVEISDLDLRDGGPAYTVDTLRALAASHPGRPLFWLIGADNLRILDQWHDHHELLQRATLVTIPRAGFTIERAALQHLDLTTAEITTLLAHVLDVPADAVSATAIREQLRRGAAPAALDPRVLGRIEELGLYRD